MVSRERVGLLARKGWWSREYVFVCSRGRAGGLASTCLRDHQPFLASTRTSCAGMLVTRGRDTLLVGVAGVTKSYNSLPCLDAQPRHDSS